MLETPHMILVFFVYGLSFFVLGLAVLIYPKKNSLFTLATDVNLVAWFGIIHGINEWLDMSLLIHEHMNIMPVLVIRAAILPLSFLFLVAFGVRTIAHSRPRYSSLKLLTAIIAFTWVAIVLFSSRRFLMGDIFARYLVCVPGTVLTSYALGLHLSQLEDTKLRCVIGNVRFMMVVFVVYGFLAGIVVPSEASIPPASLLNYDSFLATIGLPVQVFRTVCAAVLAISMLRVLKVFHWETQSRLHEGELRLTTVASAAPIILFKHDRRGVLTGLEGSNLDALDMDPAKLIGRPVSELFPDWDLTKVNAASWISGRPHNCDVTAAGRAFHLCYCPVRAQDGAISSYVGAALDITQRLCAQAEIDKYKSELANTRRLTELGTMSRAMAKELRKPLNVAALLVQRLVTELSGPDDSDKTAKALKKSLAEINDAASTVRKLCDYAQLPQSDRPEPLDLQQLFSRVMAALSERADHAKLRVSIDLTDATPCLAITERELTYVFSALIENAIAAAPGDTHSQLTVTCQSQDHSIQLVFTDNCGGIPQEKISDVFKPFAEPGGNGGMGLAIVREIVQSNAGIITVKAKPGQGTTFSLILPTLD